MCFLRGRGHENIIELIFYYNCDKNVQCPNRSATNFGVKL